MVHKIIVLISILLLSGNIYARDGYPIVEGKQADSIDVLEINTVTGIDDTTETTLETELDHDDITGAGTVDTDEEVQDSIGGILDDGTIGDIIFTYDDITPLISGEVEDDSHSHTSNTVPDHDDLNGVHQDVNTTASPDFVTLDLTGLTDGYILYLSALGLADSPIQVSDNDEIIQNTYLRQYSGQKTLTDGVVTGIYEVAIASGEIAGGQLHYTIEVKDGTDLQTHVGIITFVGVNKAGTVSSDIDEVYLAASETKVTTSGTLTDSWTVTNGTGKITVNINANTSLTPTSMVLNYSVFLNSTNVITPL